MQTITVNKKQYQIEAEADMPLLWILRDHLKLTGTKFGCGNGLCGACTVHVNDKAVRSCQISLSDIDKQEVRTIESLATSGKLHILQQAWQDISVPQCGYCQSGQIMTALALLAQNPNPDNKAIDTAMSGNICRCGTYSRIRQAIKNAAASINASSNDSLDIEKPDQLDGWSV